MKNGTDRIWRLGPRIWAGQSFRLRQAFGATGQASKLQASAFAKATARRARETSSSKHHTTFRYAAIWVDLATTNTMNSTKVRRYPMKSNDFSQYKK